MKYFTSFIVCGLLLAVSLSSCKNTQSDEIRDKARESLGVQTPAGDPAAPGAAVAHYICPNNCAGSGGATQGSCPVCGTDYVHNQAYHTQATTPAVTSPSIQQAPTDGAVAAGGVAHYICPNNCAGSGGADQGSCPVCGTAYVHNQAYHTQAATPTVTTPNVQQAPSPAQNAAGVFHYTCSNGCAGGAGAAGTCSNCGGQLAHNQAYHQ